MLCGLNGRSPAATAAVCAACARGTGSPLGLGWQVCGRNAGGWKNKVALRRWQDVASKRLNSAPSAEADVFAKHSSPEWVQINRKERASGKATRLRGGSFEKANKMFWCRSRVSRLRWANFLNGEPQWVVLILSSRSRSRQMKWFGVILVSHQRENVLSFIAHSK